MKYEETSKRLKIALSDHYMKAQELADLSGISKSSISQYVNGSHKPSNLAATKIGHILSVNPLWLMGFDVSREPVEIPAAVPGTGELLDLFFRVTPVQRDAVISLLRSFVN